MILAYGAEPDINEPYSPIFTDKNVYSWTDKVEIMIVAPSWNAHRHAIDSIGDDNGNFIKISTRENDLEPYKLTETDLNSGIFVGEVILTGFLHDTDGDGDFDTNPKTTGTGPTNGFIQTKRDDAITISFEFAENVVVTESALINWNLGNVGFFEDTYMIDQEAVLRVTDADMNLNPEAIDQVLVEVSSNSDSAGITIEAIETSDDSGLFESTISFTHTNPSNGNRLFAKPGDSVTAKYVDRTLPSPYSESDELEILDGIILESNVPPLEQVSLQEIFIADNLGNPLTSFNVGDQLQIVGNVNNQQDFTQNFIFIIQIVNDDNSVVSLSWIQGQLQPSQNMDASQSWIPAKSGTYAIEIFVWDSLNKPIPLVLPQVNSYYVQ